MYFFLGSYKKTKMGKKVKSLENSKIFLEFWLKRLFEVNSSKRGKAVWDCANTGKNL